MYFGIYDNYTIRNLKPKGKRPILIRALEPEYLEIGKIPYNIKYINDYIDVLELYFEDIVDYTYIERKDKCMVFNKEMANKLIKFINKNDFDEIMVHCYAGVSRSSALMICASKALGIQEIEDKIYKSGRFVPNKLVLNEFSKCDYIPKYNDYKYTIINTNEEIWEKEEFDIDIVEEVNNIVRFSIAPKK